jgi:hypothetical protein
MVAGAVGKAVDVFVSNSEIDVVYGSILYIDKNGRPYPMLDRRAPLWAYPYFANISHSSLYAKKSALFSCGLQFRTDLKYTGDYDWIIRLIEDRMKFVFIKAAEQKQVRVEHRVSQLAILFFAGLDAVWNLASLLVVLFKTGPRGLVLTARRWYFKYLRR